MKGFYEEGEPRNLLAKEKGLFQARSHSLRGKGKGIIRWIIKWFLGSFPQICPLWFLLSLFLISIFRREEL